MKKAIFRNLVFVIFIVLISFDLSAQTLPDPGKDPMDSTDSVSQKISVSGFFKEKTENNQSFTVPNVSFDIHSVYFPETKFVEQTLPGNPEARNPIL